MNLFVVKPILKYLSNYILKNQIHILSKMTSSGNALADRLVWVDLEMTGLNVETERIIEMACLVTDGQLNIVAEGPDIVIHESDEVLNNMNAWCKEHHGQSGLTAAVKNSTVELKEAEEVMLKFIQTHTEHGKCPLAGNSIHTDKKFLEKYMPRFVEHLHYRIIDVSTVKELCRRWYPTEYNGAPSKQLTHRALEDIKESIQELKYYRSTIFK